MSLKLILAIYIEIYAWLAVMQGFKLHVSDTPQIFVGNYCIKRSCHRLLHTSSSPKILRLNVSSRYLSIITPNERIRFVAEPRQCFRPDVEEFM